MKLVDIAVKRPVTVWMFTFAIVLFGMVSLSKLSLNLLPELSYPTLTIRTDYVGAAPAEVEQLVSKPIEESIGVVQGVRRVTSRSKAGQSDVILEFEWGTDMDMASLDVREKLDTLRLPLDVDKPLLLRFNPSMDPILRYGLSPTSGDDLDANATKQLRYFAEDQIKRKLESVEGVASVKVGGGLEHEVQVLVDQQRASQLNISLDTIINRIKAENVNTSGGRVEDGAKEYLVRTLNEFTDLGQMRDLFIATRNGRNIRLGDIAEIRDSHKEQDSITRFNGNEGVEIALYKEGDANTVQVAKNVAQRLQSISDELPTDYTLTPLYDQSRFISSAISEVQTAAIVGGILAMVVLYLFLNNLWPTLIISLSIPISVIATFNLMLGNDISLNMMSLGGVALAIGLLVDNAIVVLENIDRHKQREPNPFKAAASGTKEVSTAITASTLTTLAVFFPLVFVEGIAGQLFADQALTVTFALAASLVVALTLIPMLAAREKSSQAKAFQTPVDLGPSYDHHPTTRIGKMWRVITLPVRWSVRGVFYYLPLIVTSVGLTLFRLLKTAFGWVLRPIFWVFNLGYGGVESAYRHVLRAALKMRLVVLAAIIAVSAGAMLLLPRLGMELIPSMTQNEFFVELNLPTGTPIEHTDKVLADLATFTQSLDGVERTYSLAGTGSLMNASTSQGGEYWGKLNVVPETGVSALQRQSIQQQMRDYLRQQASVTASFDQPALFTFATPLTIELKGYDLDQLAIARDRVMAAMDSNTRFADIESSLQSGHPELSIQFDHGRLAQLGLTAPTVSQLIAAKIEGEIASRYTIGDRKVDILVRTKENQRDSIEDIGAMIVNPGQSPAVPLNAVANLSMDTGPSEITRIGQERVAVISANLAYGDLGEAVAASHALLDTVSLPATIQAQVAGQSEEMDVSFQSLQFALLLAVFMVYLVMASQFESLLHPFLILFTVPLAGAGSIYGLFLTGTAVSVVVFIGLIMLAGIVVNNAIVLVDRINQLRAEGMDRYDAICEAAESRLRPIFMTTLTTTLGLLPLAIGGGEGAEVRTPMAVTVIFGLLFATVLTLVLIPVLYSLFDRKSFSAAPQGVQHESA